MRCRKQIAGAFSANAGIVRIGSNDPRFVELPRQIGELVDDCLGVRGTDRSAHLPGVEDIEHDRRYTRLRKIVPFGGRARRAGNLVTGTNKKRHQPPTNGARGTG